MAPLAPRTSAVRPSSEPVIRGRFILGPEAHDPSIITCTGLGGVGVTMGAIAGATAAEWATEGKPTTVPGADVLRPDRPSLTEVTR